MDIEKEGYSEEVIKIASQLALRPEPPPDAKFFAKALQRRMLQELGFNLEDFTLETVCLKLYSTIDDLSSQVANLQLQVKILKQKKITPKQFITVLKKHRLFTKDQLFLFKALSTCKPTKDTEIISDIRQAKKTQNWTKENLISLVRLTRQRIKKYEIEEIIQIKPLNGKPFNGYQLILNLRSLNQ